MIQEVCKQCIAFTNWSISNLEGKLRTDKISLLNLEPFDILNLDMFTFQSGEFVSIRDLLSTYMFFFPVTSTDTSNIIKKLLRIRVIKKLLTLELNIT